MKYQFLGLMPKKIKHHEKALKIRVWFLILYLLRFIKK